MELSLPVTVIIIVVLLLISGFFSGSETALFSLSLIQKERLKNKGKKSAGLIEKLLSNPRQLIVTILVGNDMINITASVFSAYLFVTLLDMEHGKWIAIAVMTPLTLIFAEIIPKTLFMTYNERVAPIVSRPITFVSKMITPLRLAFDIIADTIIRLLGFARPDTTPAIMEDDFLDMVDSSHEEGELDGTEKELIHNVFEFSDTFINEVMTPVDEMVCLPENTASTEIISLIKANHYSRIPVYRGSIENIIGILFVKDLLKFKPQRLARVSRLLPGVIRKPYFISDQRKIDELFHIFQQERVHQAICLNRQGKVSGLVTMEDLLEELFGEIYDEHDAEAR